MAKRIREESGYSLVEVMVSIVIMTIAILPMASMFDMGLHSTTASSSYDKARMLANQKLEQAHTLAYADLRDNFPVASSTPNPSYTSSALPVPTSAGLPSGSTYIVIKQYMAPPTVSSTSFQTTSSDQGLIRITVTIQWPDNNQYTTFGLVAK